MSFRLVKGKTVVKQMPVTPSTVFAARSLVTFSSGKLIPAVAGTTAPNLAGVIVGAIAATDADYADERLVSVEIPVEKNVTYEFDVTAGLVAADIGVDVDLTDASTVNRAASAIGVIRTTKVLSTTKGQGLVKINGAY
jgi:hypothetical protein